MKTVKRTLSDGQVIEVRFSVTPPKADKAVPSLRAKYCLPAKTGTCVIHPDFCFQIPFFGDLLSESRLSHWETDTPAAATWVEEIDKKVSELDDEIKRIEKLLNMRRRYLESLGHFPSDPVESDLSPSDPVESDTQISGLQLVETLEKKVGDRVKNITDELLSIWDQDFDLSEGFRFADGQIQVLMELSLIHI